MDPAYSIFKKFFDPTQMQEIIAVLEELNIPYQVHQDAATKHVMLSQIPLEADLILKIPPQYFEQANETLRTRAEQHFNTLDPSYYLFAFSDEELLSILKTYDEWGEFDYQLAWRVLAERGHDLSAKTIEQYKQERIQQLAKPARESSAWIGLGYALALLGGLLGVGIGWFLWKHQKTLPNGEQVFAYRQSERQHGRRIFWIGIVMLIITITVKVLWESQEYQNH